MPPSSHPTPEQIEVARLRIEEAGALIAEAAKLLGRDSLSIRFEHVPDSRRFHQTLHPSGSPTRYRSTPFAPALPPDSSDFLSGSASLDQELDRRQRLALAFAKAHESDQLYHHSPRPHLHNFDWSAIQWRTRHHVACSFHTGPECDCGAHFILKVANQTWRVEHDGSLSEHVEPTPTSDTLRFYIPGIDNPILSHRGFSDQLDRDRHGTFWAPAGTAFVLGSAGGEEFVFDIDPDANSFRSICEPNSIFRD